MSRAALDRFESYKRDKSVRFYHKFVIRPKLLIDFSMKTAYTAGIMNTDIIDDEECPDNVEMVTWGEQYSTGIELIDNQHKELILLTNKLYKACLVGQDVVHDVFQEAMHKMVEYVSFHFRTEQELLEHIDFPTWKDHAKEHDKLIKDILDAAKDYETGKRYTPYAFVRTLRDWIFGHIAYLDKSYKAYVMEEKKKGLLQDL